MDDMPLTPGDLRDIADAIERVEATDLAEVPLLCPHGSSDFCGVCIAGYLLASSWLAERDARIKAEAWDEGFIARLGDIPLYKGRPEWGNPYREAQP